MSSPFPPSQGPGYFSDNPFQTPEMANPAMMPRRGMFNQVRIVAILNIVQGLLELFMAAMLAFAGIAFVATRDQMVQDMGRGGDATPELTVNIMTWAFLGIGGVLLIVAVLRIVASARNFFFLSRTLGIVSLFAGLLSVFTFYCGLTSVAIAIYGLIVMFNREVAEAFEMRTKGATADDVLRNFNSRPY